MSEPIMIFSKSRAEKWWECPRLEYLQYVWGGTGLRAAAIAFELEFGIIIHNASMQIATFDHSLAGNIYVTTKQAMYDLGKKLGMLDEHTKQWAAIAEGLVRAYHAKVWPGILREFEVVDVEAPCVYPIDQANGVWFVARPDLILRSRITKELWYWEHKTTGSVEAKWINSWTTAVQVHSGIKAAERKYGEKFGGCYVLGWYKGYKNNYDGTQNSPFAYGQVNRGAPGVVGDKYLYERPKYYKGWEKFPTWALVDGLGPWVAQMPDDIMLKQFAKTPPMTMREDLAESFFAQLKAHAADILRFKVEALNVIKDDDAKALLDKYFPQNFAHCDPSWGRYTCVMKDLCWQGWVSKDPVGSSLYTRNDPNAPHRTVFLKMIEAEPK
jgi:hypothetical protein